jgi:hypothetical protein
MLPAGSWMRLAMVLGMLVSAGCSKQKTTTMAKEGKVYLVSRSEYEVPRGHRVTVYDSPDLLTWFQDYWASAKLEKVVSGEELAVDGGHTGWSAFSQVFQEMEEKQPPENWSQLKVFLSECPTEGAILVSEHAIQGITDDDEIDKAWYLFDEEFAKANPGRVSYLLHDDWRMDEAVAAAGTVVPEIKMKAGNPGQGAGVGRVYCVFASAQDGVTIGEITGNLRFDGMRLPQFRDYLCGREVAIVPGRYRDREAEWTEELLLLRLALLRSAPQSFDQVLKDLGPTGVNEWLPHARALSDLTYQLKQPQFLAGDRASGEQDWKQLEEKISAKETSGSWRHEMQPPLVQTSPHFCQIRFHEKSAMTDGRSETHFARSWFFFDDLWVAAHPELAESLLRYGAGWDVLFDEKEE